MRSPDDFEILNQKISIADSNAWNDSSRDKLLLYHLHYMDDLTAEGASARGDWHSRLIDNWISENTAVAGNGWEPYPLSLRITNWIKWQLAGNELPNKAVKSLWEQAGVLYRSIEYHLLANHLLANAKALFFAGIFFLGKEATDWLARSRKLLETELDEQVLNDGGHFEFSTMYHAIVLEDILDVINISHTFGIEAPANLDVKARLMMRWLDHMTHPDGQLAHFNDSVAGVAPTLTNLRDYAGRLGLYLPESKKQGLVHFVHSGYARYEDCCFVVVVDCGDIGPSYQPGHGHCDCLSFELSVGKQRMLVNTGISTYNVSERREHERSTAAHNTVSIEGAEQSEIWSAFRVGRRAHSFDVDVGRNHVSAAHDGYRQLGIVHRRRFEFGRGVIKIRDKLESKSRVRGSAHFHFHPDVMPVRDGNVIRCGALSLYFEYASQVCINEYQYCLGFNVTMPALEVRVDFEAEVTTAIEYADTVY